VHNGQFEFMRRLYNAQYDVQEESASNLKKKRTNFTKVKGESTSKDVKTMNQDYESDSE
jgi:hypothetical protein